MTLGETSYVAYVHAPSSLAWALERRWAVLDALGREGWHLTRWCGVWHGEGYQGSKKTYPYISGEAELRALDERTFNQWWQACGTQEKH